MKILGERLKQLRESRGMTQTELAQLLGLQQTSIFRYESGNTNPTAEVLLKIADTFDVSLDYLFGRTDHPGGLQYSADPQLAPELNKLAEQFFEPGTRVNRELKRSVIRIMAEESASYGVVKRKEGEA